MKFAFALCFSLLSTTAISQTCRDEVLPEAKEIIAANKFVVGRGITDYVRDLGDEFFQSLERLGPQDHWLDAGAGQARAIREYLTGELGPGRPMFRDDANVYPSVEKRLMALLSRTSKQKARSTASSYVVEPDPALENFKLNFSQSFNLVLGLFQKQEGSELTKFGLATLLSDVAGDIPYASNPGEMVRLYFSYGAPDVEIYVLMGEPGNSSTLKSTVLTPRGRIPFLEWITSLPGTKSKTIYNPYSYYADSVTVKLTRDLSSPLLVPDLKGTIKKKGKPPEFDFEELPLAL